MAYALVTQFLAFLFDIFFDGQFGYSMVDFQQRLDPDGAILPVVAQIFMWTGIGLAFVFFVWNLLREVFLPVTGIKDPVWVLWVRAFVAVFAALSGTEIINKVIFPMMKVPLDAMNAISITANPRDMSWNFEGAWQAQGNAWDFSALVGLVVPGADNNAVAAIDAAFSNVILLFGTILFAIKLIRFFVEIVERYILMHLLVYTTPLASATLASPSLKPIFGNWCTMLGGQMLLIILNSMSIKLVLSSYYTLIGNVLDATSNYTVTTLINVLILTALMNILQRIDTYMNQLGINAGITGNPFDQDYAMAMKGTSKMLSPFTNMGKGLIKTAKGSIGNRKNSSSQGASTGDAKITPQVDKGTASGSVSSGFSKSKGGKASGGGTDKESLAAQLVDQSRQSNTAKTDGKISNAHSVSPAHMRSSENRSDSAVHNNASTSINNGGSTSTQNSNNKSQVTGTVASENTKGATQATSESLRNANPAAGSTDGGTTICSGSSIASAGKTHTSSTVSQTITGRDGKKDEMTLPDPQNPLDNKNKRPPASTSLLQ